MTRRTCIWLTLAVLFAGWSLPSWSQDDAGIQAEAAAMAVLDQFMTTFNSRDMDAWEGTFNFPHIRIAGGKLVVLEAPGQQDEDLFERLSSTGWDHSAWTTRKIIVAGPSKVHVDVTFTRYRSDNSHLATYRSLYIVTKENGKWGVQARSSFAP